MKEHINSR